MRADRPDVALDWWLRFERTRPLPDGRGLTTSDAPAERSMLVDVEDGADAPDFVVRCASPAFQAMGPLGGDICGKALAEIIPAETWSRGVGGFMRCWTEGKPVEDRVAFTHGRAEEVWTRLLLPFGDGGWRVTAILACYFPQTAPLPPVLPRP